MRRMMSCKGGVSPLIATILLIAFAVALGAVVMNIGKSKILTPGSGDLFSILELDGNRLACYRDAGPDSTLEITIKNNGISDIHDFQMSVIGTQDIINKQSTLDMPIAKAEVLRIKLVYDSSRVGVPKKVILTPTVIENGEQVLKGSLELDNLPQC